MKNFLKIWVLAPVFCFPLFSVPSLADEPKANVKDYAIPPTKTFSGEELELKAVMEKLFEASRSVNDKGGARTKARAIIENSLDWERVSQICLGDARYKKLTAENKSQFRALLKEVVAKTAYTRLDTFWNDTRYQFKKITVKGKDGTIVTKFNVGKESFELQYFVNKKGSNWLVYDISFDDLRYSENINEQIEAFLKEKSFTALLEKLRKRLGELDGTSKS